MASEIHPDAQAFLDRMDNQPPPPDDAKESRKRHRRNSLPSGEPEPVGDVDDVVIRGEGHGIPVRVYKPKGTGPFPILVWAHGGGAVLGDIETEDSVGRALTNASNCIVASVDYRLAPEHPFPAGLRDLLSVTNRFEKGLDIFDADTNRIAIGGASAGGRLAAGTTLLARDSGAPKINYQVLVYPAVSYSRDFPSYEKYDGIVISRDRSEWFQSLLLDDPLHGHNPYYAPLEAPNHAGLPPATVITAGFDPLRDEGEAYANSLSDADVSVRHRHYDDMVHTFFGKLRNPEWDRAREAVKDVGMDLQERWG